MFSMENMEKQFNIIAEEYDANRKKFIPCFEDFYENTTKFIATNMDAPKRIFDLGAGTGLLSYYWYKHFPRSEYVLIDVAEEMLKIAQKRFYGLHNVTYRVADYTDGFPKDTCDTVISALSVHHLEQEEKQKLFSRIYDVLPENGIFVNYDQFCAGQPKMNKWFDTYWEDHLMKSGLTARDIALWQERRTLDRECSAEQETELLYRCNFQTVKCVYSYQKFSVIVAIK